MISTTLVALSAFILSVSADQIQSENPSFYNAGIQGCVSVADNADGEAVVIHDCNTDTLANQDWNATYSFKGDTAPSPITIFGNKCIDVTGGVNADGTKLQIWTCSGGPNQQWVNTLAHTFKWAAHPDKCIDLTDGKLIDGTPLQLYTCTDNDSNQIWGSAPNPDAQGPQIILGGNPQVQPPPITGQPFCVGAASNNDGAAVVLLGCGISNAGTDFPNGNFNWTAPFAPLTGQIKTFDNKCLDVTDGSNVNGVKLQIWTCATGNTNQLFTVHGRTTIEWKGTGKCLDLTDGNSTIGNPIQLWDCTDNDTNQQWLLDPVSPF